MHLFLRPRPTPIFEHSHSVVFQQHPVSVRCRRYCVCHFSLLPRTKTGSCTASIVLRQSASLTGVRVDPTIDPSDRRRFCPLCLAPRSPNAVASMPLTALRLSPWL